MIEFVQVTNFRKLKSGTYDFTGGLNIICGDNAAGKTTLTYAIAFALYGAKAVSGKAENIPTWGESNCNVILKVDGFTIERSLKNCTVTSESGNIVASGNSVCSDFIEDNITGVDLKGFKLLNWSSQGETGALLTLGATQINRDVEKFSGVDFIDKVIKLASSDLSDLKSKLQILEEGSRPKRDIVSGLASTQAKLSETVNEISSVECKIQAESDKADALNMEISKANSNNQLVREFQSSIADLEQEFTRVNSKIEVYEDSFKRVSKELGQLPQTVFDTGELSERIQTSESSLNAYGKLKTEHKRLKEELEDLSDKADIEETLTRKVLDLQSTYDQKLLELNKLEDSKSELSKNVRTTKKKLDSGICTECGSKLVGEAVIIKLKDSLQVDEESLELLLGELETITSEYEYISRELSPKKNKLNKLYVGAKNRQEEVAERLEILEGKLSVDIPNISKEGLDGLRAGLEEAKSLEKSRSDLLNRISECEQTIKTLTEYREDISRKIEEKKDRFNLTEIHPDEMSRLNSSLDRCISTLYSYKDSKNSFLQVKVDIDREIEGLTVQMELANKVDNLTVKKSSIDKFVKLIRRHRSEFLESVWDQILGSSSEFLRQSTDGKITELKKDLKEGFMFLEDEHLTPVSVASGAQRGFIGVAARLALSETLNASTELVILDEPTEAMREQNALNLSGGLLNKSQVLMITHKVTDSMSASNIIEI